MVAEKSAMKLQKKREMPGGLGGWQLNRIVVLTRSVKPSGGRVTLSDHRVRWMVDLESGEQA